MRHVATLHILTLANSTLPLVLDCESLRKFGNLLSVKLTPDVSKNIVTAELQYDDGGSPVVMTFTPDNISARYGWDFD